MKYILAISLLSFSFNILAVDKVVYGEDDRKDIFESTNALYKTLASSTAAMISTSSLVATEDGLLQITAPTLESDGICSDARFAKQITAANCSGFLVGDQYLVTAGHCIQSMSDCERYSWVFGYANETEEKKEHKVAPTEVYTCTEVISQILDRSTMNDYAFVKLDRKVVGHAPLKFRKTGKITDKSDIVVIGHPSGLPTKIADGANVRDNKNKYFFQATLDTFGGNSGSAVFNSKTGLVEGILVRGETDYEGDPVQNCIRPKVCKLTECRGEDVTRITNIKELMKIRK
jgi:V8-like Glu-specific endopeptidase